MNTDLFNYNLPPNLIAQSAIYPKDRSKLMVINKKTDEISHTNFHDLSNIIENNSVIVLNNSKVLKSRIYCRKSTGALIEFLLIKKNENCKWTAYAKPLKRLKIGESTFMINNEHNISSKDKVKLLAINNDNSVEVEINVKVNDIYSLYGCYAIPPYIKSYINNDSDYQTCYAKKDGSIAAPTAGLHFTEDLINILKKKGIKFEYINLEIGPGTFKPVKTADINNHEIHSEYFEIDKKTSMNLNKYKNEGRNIYVVGTTTCRALESSISDSGEVMSFKGYTSIFIKPGYKFKFVENLITNFHLPKSTLLMLVSAFYDREKVLNAYNIAIENNYRFYSLGDSMIIKK